MPNDPDVDAAVRAILDDTPIDWTGLESSADLGTRTLTEQLKILSTVAHVHRAETDSRSAGIGQWGALRLLEKVGEGAFGEVYRAWDPRLDREVALKLLPASASSNSGDSPIINEGRQLARVRHPNVATIYGAESIDGRIGLWMEFVHGRTLDQLLKSGHQFSVSQVAGIGQQLCRAVSAVHAAGLLHRDIKAQNVMRAADGRLVLMDFGASRDQSEGGSDPTGTPLYLAPEIFRGEPATAQSDVYSTGVLLYHLLTGRFPVNGRSLTDLRAAHDRHERIPLDEVRPDLPPAMLRIVRRTTEADPASRYESCDRLAADLAPLAAPPQKPRWKILVAVAAAVVVAVGGAVWLGNAGVLPSLATLWRSSRPVIVVRPFRNLRTEPGSDLMVEGLTIELIRNLSIINGLDVRSATSSFALKNDVTLAEIGKQLGVTMVLEGSISGSGDAVRVQAELVQVGRDTPLWTNKFDRQLTDVLAIQDEIARSVVNQLRLTLGQGQRRYDLDLSAQSMYLQARALTERGGTENAAAAVKLFEQIIARDSAFAPAYAGLADAYGAMSQTLPDVLGLPQEQALTLMRSAAGTAIELDPVLAESHAAMGFLYSREFSREHAWEDADRSYRRAIELNPGLTHVYTSYWLTTLLPLGRFQEAESLLREALRRDPLSLDVQRGLGLLLLTTHRYEEAIPILEHVLSVDAENPYALLLLARARSLSGRIGDAMPYWESVSGQVGSQHWMANAYVHGGRRAEIERLAAQPQVAYRQLLFYAALGDKDRALDALARAAEEAPHRTVRLLWYPELDGLRDDPRFDAVRATFHLR